MTISTTTRILPLIRELAQRRGVAPSWLDAAFSTNATIVAELILSPFRSRFARLGGSQQPLVGQCVTEVPTDEGLVTLATPEAIAACNYVSGLVIETAPPGEIIRIAHHGTIPREFLPFLGEGEGDDGIWNVDTLRVERRAGRTVVNNTVVGNVMAFGLLAWSSA